jgi:hypothetical protein
MNQNSIHQFHIPVMGLSFTIDSPIKVAQYGIASTISIIEDKLIEMMRAYYYRSRQESYVPITTDEEDYRARRITDYLNLVNTIVHEQFEKLRTSAFEAGSEISKYLEMLPTKNKLRDLYFRMMQADEPRKSEMQQYIRNQIVPGAIDVNIMTKVDKDNFSREGDLIPDSSDALAALRGYACSNLSNSSVIFSAGMNPRLFNYLEKLKCFNAKGWGLFEKKIVIKVSDYRSAIIQGKYLAKKGLWVSEFRIESGLNCGGHAFASDGNLLGPILEEFKSKKEELKQTLFQLYKPAAETKTGITFTEPHPVKITVQGGIGTHEEAEFLLRHYNIGSTGWGTPFLLCPEATTVDQETIRLLCDANEKDVVLSKNSPLGIRFNYLKNTSAEKEKYNRILKGRPGSPCTEKHLVSNTEFTTKPICTASHKYQVKKIAQLNSLGLSNSEYQKRYNEIVSKECLCVGLSNSVVHVYELPPIKNLTAVTICPGPNVVYFDKVVTLKQMTDHIYGRSNIMQHKNRPHMFIKEIELNVEYLKEQCETDGLKISNGTRNYACTLLQGISYYLSMAELIDEDERRREIFIRKLKENAEAIKRLALVEEEIEK